MTDQELLLRDKYEGDANAHGVADDLARLEAGEPLAYVIGWAPFLGLRVLLSSVSEEGEETRALIPRPETEWWTELLVAHLKDRFGVLPFTFLDLCAGSGAIGLKVLQEMPYAQVSFGDVVPEYAALIAKNILENNLDAARADIRTGDLFEPFGTARFDFIATNPPYIPGGRILDDSVSDYEPGLALFSEADGLGVIRRIATDAPLHLMPEAGLWMECDTDNIEEAAALLESAPGASWKEVSLCTDLYGRPRLIVGEWQ